MTIFKRHEVSDLSVLSPTVTRRLTERMGLYPLPQKYLDKGLGRTAVASAETEAPEAYEEPEEVLVTSSEVLLRLVGEEPFGFETESLERPPYDWQHDDLAPGQTPNV